MKNLVKNWGAYYTWVHITHGCILHMGAYYTWVNTVIGPSGVQFGLKSYKLLT